ncbi:Cytochrome P450 78A5 [Ananas comosus]|uniref:Cytochrome P450 78A5 n=1 Tax=Ananas comosus TaxID=4615 RepID=A0A199UUD2_ANACO|nr:Cytochrome P450 78A5 [Ananas comosus]
MASSSSSYSFSHLDLTFLFFLLPSTFLSPLMALLVLLLCALWFYRAPRVGRVEGVQVHPGAPGRRPRALRPLRAPRPRLARQIRAGDPAHGVLGGAHPVRRLVRAQHGPGDPEQLRLRRSPRQGIRVRAPLPPRHGLRPLRRVLAQPPPRLRHPLVRPAGSRLARTALIGDRMLGDVETLMRRDGSVEIKRSSIRISEQLDGERVRENFDFAKGRARSWKGCEEGYELLGLFNWSDHFPILAGRAEECRSLVKRVNVFVGEIIEEHRMRRRRMMMSTGGGGVMGDVVGDFVDVLLDLEKEAKLSDADIVAVLW